MFEDRGVAKLQDTVVTQDNLRLFAYSVNIFENISCFHKDVSSNIFGAVLADKIEKNTHTHRNSKKKWNGLLGLGHGISSLQIILHNLCNGVFSFFLETAQVNISKPMFLGKN